MKYLTTCGHKIDLVTAQSWQEARAAHQCVYCKGKWPDVYRATEEDEVAFLKAKHSRSGAA
jgi:hypothetical protein